MIERGHVLGLLGVIPGGFEREDEGLVIVAGELAVEREEQRKRSKEIDEQRRGIS